MLEAAKNGKEVRRRRAIIDAVMWIRDSWYVMAGHLACLVLASSSKRKRVGNYVSGASPDGESADDLEWKRSRIAFDRYVSLRQSDRGAADRFLSKLVKPKESLTVALRSPSNTLLSTGESLGAIKDDLCNRSSGGIAKRCGILTRTTADFVSRVRRSRALTDPAIGTVRAESNGKFSESELGAVIGDFSRSSVSLRNCYAAVKAVPVGGRRVTLAIANMCFEFGLFPTTATLREFNPIRKKGPKVVQSVSCLRPISFSSDFAAVLDALLLKRCRNALVEFWGPCQSGGVYDALLCVLAVVLIAQLRIGVGLPILLVFLDLAAAFDVADRNDMRAALFEAGVSGKIWMLIDDLLASDHCRLHVGEFISSHFQLDAGTAQGRRLSVALFNGQMRYLHNIMADHTRGTGAWCSRWARRVVQLAGQASRSHFEDYNLGDVMRLGSELRTSDGDEFAAAHVLGSVSSVATRLGAVDELSSCRITDIQYVDDLVAPASSSEQVDAIWSAAEVFSFRHGGSFNIGPTKSTVLPIGQSRYVSDTLAAVETYCYLGVVLDRFLNFGAQLSSMLRKGHEAFLDFLGCSLSIYLPFPLQATAVTSRIGPVVLYGSEFCILVPDAMQKLNRLQATWARHLLGFPQSRAGAVAWLVAECGWQRRLGTRMYERAVLLKARAQLLPLGHPTRILLGIAGSSTNIGSWAARVASLQCLPDFSSPIPDILECTPEDILVKAYGDADARRSCLDYYRKHFVSPAFDLFDRSAFLAAGDTVAWPYPEYQLHSASTLCLSLDVDWGFQTWNFYRAWATIRVLGRWPLAVFGVGDTPLLLPSCPLCGTASADIQHLLLWCPGCHDLRVTWLQASPLCSLGVHQLQWDSMRYAIFGHSDDSGCNGARILFVGQCAFRAASCISVAASAEQIDHLISAAATAATDELNAALMPPTRGR